MSRPTKKQKVYFSYERQIEKLKSDGLIISDERRARLRLKWEGYFNFAVGYNRLFKGANRRYIQGTTFEHVEALFDFDKNLRRIIYEYAQTVECNLKALVSDEISKNYGVKERDYLREENFSEVPEDLQKVRWIIGTCKATLKDCLKENSGSYRDYVAYYKKQYGHVPFWALVRALSFGNTSKLLRLLKRKDGERIAGEYGVGFLELCNLTELFVSFRNIAAHGERAYCARVQTVSLSKELSIFKKLELPTGQVCGENDFFAFLIAAKYLLSSSEYEECHQRVVRQVDMLKAALPSWAFDKVMLATGLLGKWRELNSLRI